MPSFLPRKESVEKWGAKNFRTLLSTTIFRPPFFDSHYFSAFENQDPLWDRLLLFWSHNINREQKGASCYDLLPILNRERLDLCFISVLQA